MLVRFSHLFCVYWTGYSLWACLDVLSLRARLTGHSLWFILYQRLQIQQTKWQLETYKQKNKDESKHLINTNKGLYWNIKVGIDYVLFLLTFPHLHKPSRQCSDHGFSVKTVWVSSASIFTAWSLCCLGGHPCVFYRGVVVVAAFFGYLFGLLQKSTSPAVREPQCLTKKKKANVKHQATENIGIYDIKPPI